MEGIYNDLILVRTKGKRPGFREVLGVRREGDASS